MMRKFTTYLFISASLWLCLASCDDDEASAPPKTNFTQDKTTVLTGEEVTFVVDEVSADAIALLPYGQEETGKGGVLISRASFTNGKATVVFKYEFVGQFSPVVVTSNFSGDGESVERTYSDAKSITVSSDNTSIDEFSFDGSTKTTIDHDAGTIAVEMAYGNDKWEPYNIGSLKAKFTAAPYTTVKVAGVAQTSGETVNNFNVPVTYSVTAHNGETADYTVTVTQAPIESNVDLSSFGGKSISTKYKDKAVQGFVDNTDDFVVLIAPFGQNVDVLDSVRVNFETAGKFTRVHYATAVDTLKQDSLLNLTTTPRKTVTVEAQDLSTATYTLEPTIAPKLEASFGALNPVIEGAITDFSIALKLLKGTPINALSTNVDITANAGQTIDNIQVVEGSNPPMGFTSGDNLDFTNGVKFIVTVTDATIGRTFDVVYTAAIVFVE